MEKNVNLIPLAHGFSSESRNLISPSDYKTFLDFLKTAGDSLDE
jgi:hypothetical protein